MVTDGSLIYLTHDSLLIFLILKRMNLVCSLLHTIILDKQAEYKSQDKFKFYATECFVLQC
jgi:hypothetical protein